MEPRQQVRGRRGKVIAPEEVRTRIGSFIRIRSSIGLDDMKEQPFVIELACDNRIFEDGSDKS
ncbi:hypothetical protein CTA1_279 [Colletotrichum tanaceti]|uniref:Uncharacterized protein n=1 Tax=Colletotrichum tanaceti TaxID=1306861 RepID=A0A4U6X4C3_9PEZI|nr:hypothetical protein CTA1_279 [Colletotrichum tanaceti]